MNCDGAVTCQRASSRPGVAVPCRACLAEHADEVQQLRRTNRYLTKENLMGRQSRVALLGLASASLIALMIDYMLKELGRSPAH